MISAKKSAMVAIVLAIVATGFVTMMDSEESSAAGSYEYTYWVTPGQYIDLNVCSDAHISQFIYEAEVKSGSAPGLNLINERYTVGPPPNYKAYLRGNFTGTEDATITVGNRGGSDTVTYHINLKRVVSFDANGGTANTTPLESQGNAITLPTANRTNYTFTGWFTAATGGSLVGVGGASYTPTASITLYAQYTQQAVQIYPGSTQVASGGILNYTPSVSPAGATVTIVSDSTGCGLTMSGGKVVGPLQDILPGNYYVTLRATYPGYESATATLTISVPIFVYDPLTGVLETNTPYTYTLTANPSSSKIVSFTVRDGANQTANPNDYVINKADKSISMNFKVPGQFKVTLTIGATGYTSTTKDLIFEVVEPVVIIPDPTLLGILATPHATLPGAFYLVARQPANYNTITWDFGDGTSEASSDNVLHQWRTSGIKTILVTLKNTTTGATATATIDVEVIIPLTSRSDAWVGIEYSYAFPAGTEETLTLTSDIPQAWLSLSEYDLAGTRMVLLSGTPLPGLENTTLEVTVTGGTATIMSWTISIWAQIDENSITVGFDYELDGYKVTLHNRGVSGPGVIMFIDWGSTDITGSGRYPSDAPAIATYNNDGYYHIIMTLLINGEDYATSRYVTVPSGGSASSFTIDYFANNGTSQSTMQNGKDFVVIGCSFSYGDHTFARWNTEMDGSGASYNPGQPLNLTANLQLYAIWTSPDGNEGGGGVGNDDGGDLFGIDLKIIMIIIVILIILLILAAIWRHHNA